MLSFFGYDDLSREKEQGHPVGQPIEQAPLVQETYVDLPQGHPIGQPMGQAPLVQETYVDSAEVEGPRFVQEPSNMMRYLGSTTDGKFMQDTVVNGHSAPPFQQQPIAKQVPVVNGSTAPFQQQLISTQVPVVNGHSSLPFQQQPIYTQVPAVNGHSVAPFQQQQPLAQYPLSSYCIAPGAPTPSKKVVSERAISRDELFATGNLVEAPSQKPISRPEVSPLMMDVPGGSMQMNAAPMLVTSMPMRVQMPAPMGGSVQLSPGLARGPVMLPGGSVQMVPMGGSVQLSAGLAGGPVMVPGGSVQMSAKGTGGPGTVIMAPQSVGFTAPPPSGSLPLVASCAMGGSMQMSAAPMGMPQGGSITMPAARPAGGFVRELTLQMGAPGNGNTAPPMPPMMVAPGGSYNAAPMKTMMAVPGGSFTAQPMQPMMVSPGGSKIAPPMPPMLVAPGGSYTAAPMQPMMAVPGGSFTALPMQPMMAAPGGLIRAAPMQPMVMPASLVQQQTLPPAGKPVQGDKPKTKAGLNSNDEILAQIESQRSLHKLNMREMA